MILLSYFNSSIKGTEILDSIYIFFSFATCHFCMCVIWQKNLLFSTLILGSVFNDYVVFYKDINTFCTQTIKLLLYDITMKSLLKKLDSNVTIFKSFSEVADVRTLHVDTTQNIMIRTIFQSNADITKCCRSCYLHRSDSIVTF